jgi:hypothetical protein
LSIKEKPIDTPQMIEYCLNCQWDECWNCLGQRSCYSYGLRLELGLLDKKESMQKRKE